jgi:hypothetical protein
VVVFVVTVGVVTFGAVGVVTAGAAAFGADVVCWAYEI